MNTGALMKRPLLLLAVILLANAALTTAAMRRTSTTFDEIVLMAGGARGFHSGLWDIAPEHPPLMQYIYGLPVYLAGPQYPDESNVTPAMRKPMGYRYAYSEHFFFADGVQTERLVFIGRLPAVIISLLLITLVFLFTRRVAGDEAAVLAAMLTAFMPDLLAHGGVAYNDVPVAAAVFGAVWLIDVALRRPGVRTGLLAGAAIGLALGVKNSAVGLGPIACVLLLVELIRSRHDAEWRRRIVPAALCTIIGAYIALVVIYRGDFLLKEYQYAVSFTLSQVTERSAPSYLLGSTSPRGWWYFFPVAFIYKTSAGLHVLMALALGAFVLEMRKAGAATRLLASGLRAPLIALLVFGLLLIRSKLDIGFRYALPAMPFIMVLTAAGAVRVWHMSTRTIHGVMVAAMIWLVVHPVSYYPRFLAYISEYGPGRDENYRVLADSSLDWGQGLIELREFMKEHDIPRIYLSYFGSAWPQAYGIEYVPAPSFFVLKPGPLPANAPEPKWVVISATNMTGTYFNGDPFARFRETKPDYVIGHTMYAFRLTPDSTGAQP
jgi:hypothetical protein